MAKNKEKKVPKEKKPKKPLDIKNVLVYICMFLLVLVIALPPIFRIVFKDTNTSTNAGSTGSTQTMTALNCSASVNNYTITIISSYEGDTLNRVSINYVQNTEIAVDPAASVNIDQEIALLRTSPSFTETLEENSNKFELTKENFDTNPNDEIAKNYYNSKEEQKLRLTEFGYSCQEVSM